jgi:ABC-type glycerol-3-phosphate transport system permease component
MAQEPETKTIAWKARYQALKNKDREELLGLLGTNTIILLGVIVTAFPVYYMIISSSFSQQQFYVFPPRVIPGGSIGANINNLFSETRYLRTLLNTLIYAGSIIVGSIILGTLTGYAFSMFTFRGRKPLFGLIIAMLSVPFQLIAIPLFTILVRFNLVNTYIGGILPLLVFPVVFLMIKQNFDQLGLDEILNSARIDGASEFQIFYHIALPLMRPAIAAAAIVGFLLKAGGLFWPLIVFRSPEMHTVTIFISQQIGIQSATNWTALMPAGAILTVPLLAVTIYFQKYFIKGLTSGSFR